MVTESGEIVAQKQKIDFDEERYRLSLVQRPHAPYQIDHLKFMLPWPIESPASILQYPGDPQEGLPRIHRGIDIQAAVGTPIYAVQRGKVAIVEESERNRVFGTNLCTVFIYDGHNGVLHQYSHLDTNSVDSRLRDGQEVSQKFVLGSLGVL